jgi:hypothetical protein
VQRLTGYSAAPTSASPNAKSILLAQATTGNRAAPGLIILGELAATTGEIS